MVAEPQEYQYNAEYPIVTGDMDETVIITYSPKYKAYQQKIREGQIQRAMKMMQSPGKSRKGKNPMILPVSSRKLPHHEIRIRSKTCICEAGRQNQGSLFNLPHQPAGLPPVREKTG